MEKSEKSAEHLELKILTNKMKEDLFKDVKTEIERIGVETDPVKLSRELNKYLEENKGGPGWNIVLGNHFFGICSFVDGFYLEFQIGDYRFLVFRCTEIC